MRHQALRETGGERNVNLKKRERHEKSTKILAEQLKEALCEEIQENLESEKGAYEDEVIAGNEAFRIKDVGINDEGGLEVLLEETWLDSDGLVYRKELELEECSLTVLMSLLNYLEN